jgi:hypothetical protein
VTFISQHSAGAFLHWLEDQGLSTIYRVIANSSKICLDMVSEPFVPLDEKDIQEVCEEICEEPQKDVVQSSRENSEELEANKKRTIEKLYHYYNFLLLEQNRDRLSN